MTLPSLNFSLDYFLVSHIGMTHPDIWMLWVGFILSVANTIALLRGRNR